MRRFPRDRLGRPLPAGSPDELASGLDPDAAGLPPAEALEQAVRLFDEQRFFEAHEWLESIWKSDAIPEAERGFWQGVTQLAVAFCHCQRGNRKGALALLARAARRLDACPSPHRGIDTTALIAAARSARQALQGGQAPADLAFPRFPRTPPAP